MIIRRSVKYAILMLLCVAVGSTYAKGDSITPQHKAQYEKQFNTQLFAKCNPCHKPLESVVVGNKNIPSYIAMSNMGESTVRHGIDHGGHLSSADKKRIYAIIHPVAESKKKAMKKTKKHRKSVKRMLS